MKNSRLKTIIVILSLLVFMLSLTQNAYCTGNCASGLLAFLTGWLGMVVELGDIISSVLEKDAPFNTELGSSLIWLANPLYFASLFFFSISGRAGLLFSVITLLTMACFPLFSQVLINEAGHYGTIKSLEPGYYLWLGSAAILFFGSLILLVKRED